MRTRVLLAGDETTPGDAAIPQFQLIMTNKLPLSLLLDVKGEHAGAASGSGGRHLEPWRLRGAAANSRCEQQLGIENNTKT
jgi:hypothetical protein